MPVDAGAPAAFDRAVHRPISRTIGRSTKVPGQPLHERAYGRHRVAATRRIGELKLETVTWVPVAVGTQASKRFARARIWITEKRRRQRLPFVIQRQQVGAKACLAIAFRANDGLRRLGKTFHESTVE